MRSRFAILLALAVVCVTTAWASWTPAVLVTSGSEGRSIYGNNARKLVFASDGIGHVTWAAGGRIGCNRFEPSSGWAADFQVTPTGDFTSVALDADGKTIHVVWEDDFALGYRKCMRGLGGSDEWGPVESLYSTHIPSNPAVACVPGDQNHVVACWWEAFSTGGRRSKTVEAIGFIECIDGTWGTPIRLDSTTAYMRRCPSIAVAPNGDVFVAYFANDDNSSGLQVYVKMRHNGIWGSTVDVTPGMGSDMCNWPAIEVNPQSANPHIVFRWRKITRISKKVSDTTWAVYHTYRNSQGAWQMPGLISVPRPVGGEGYGKFQPTLAFTGAGAAYASWSEYVTPTSHGNMYTYCSFEGGPWSAPAWLTSDPSADYEDNSPYFAVDDNAQTVHAVWDRVYPGVGWPTEIWWSSVPLGDGGGGMGQSVALPQSGIELFPNPARAGRVAVQYSLTRAEPLRVTLLDVSGRAVRSSALAAEAPVGRCGARSSGEGSFSIDVSGLHAGVYILQLESGTNSQTRKLVIQ